MYFDSEHVIHCNAFFDQKPCSTIHRTELPGNRIVENKKESSSIAIGKYVNPTC